MYKIMEINTTEYEYVLVHSLLYTRVLIKCKGSSMLTNYVYTMALNTYNALLYRSAIILCIVSSKSINVNRELNQIIQIKQT